MRPALRLQAMGDGVIDALIKGVEGLGRLFNLCPVPAESFPSPLP